MNPQIYGYFLEKALAAGALDVFSAPVQMKKNRPGILVTLLCKPEDALRFEDMLFAETTTLGVRGYTAERRVLRPPLGIRAHPVRRRAHQSRPPQRPHPPGVT